MRIMMRLCNWFRLAGFGSVCYFHFVSKG